MIEVSVTGFQSIKQVDVRVDRFTALVGRSNIGKSAIVRAVKAALTGTAGTDFVRHDRDTCARLTKGNKKCKCKCTVRVKTPTLEFLWEKGDADNCYTVWRDGREEVFDRLDRGTPDFLSPDFTPIRMGDSNNLLNVSDQFDPIFLLGDPGSTVADVLSDVAKLDSLNAALRAVAKDSQQTKSVIKVREQDIQSATARLAGYGGLPDLLASSEALQARWGGLQALQVRVEHLRGLLYHYEALTAEIHQLERVLAIKVPSGVAVQQGLGKASDAYGFYLGKTGLDSEIGSLEALLALKVPSAAPVQDKVAGLLTIWGLLSAVLPVARDVSELNAFTTITVPGSGDLPDKLARLSVLSGWLVPLEDLQRTCAGLEALSVLKVPEPPPALLAKLARIEQLSALRARVLPVASEVESLTADIALLGVELAELRESLADQALCPTCGRPVIEGEIHNEIDI